MHLAVAIDGVQCTPLVADEQQSAVGMTFEPRPNGRAGVDGPAHLRSWCFPVARRRFCLRFTAFEHDGNVVDRRGVRRYVAAQCPGARIPGERESEALGL